MTQVGRKATEKKRKRKRKRKGKRKRKKKSGGLNPAHGKNIWWVVLYLKRYVM